MSTLLAVILLVSAHTDSFTLPYLCRRDSLFFSLSLNALFYLILTLSLFHLYLTPTILSVLSPFVFICSSVRWPFSTLMRGINANVLSVMEPELYWDIGGFTPAFTNSHTSSGLLAKGSAMSDGITSFTPSFTEIQYLLEGISPGTKGSLRWERGKNHFLTFAMQVDDWKCHKCGRDSHEQ